METESTVTQPTSEAWSTKSKKDLLLGLIIAIAGLGTEPFFGSLNTYALLFSLLIILVGIYFASLGYVER